MIFGKDQQTEGRENAVEDNLFCFGDDGWIRLDVALLSSEHTEKPLHFNINLNYSILK